jgi:hypothetical protein
MTAAGYYRLTVNPLAKTFNIEAQSATPTASPDSGVVTYGQTVTLDCNTDEAVIYYTDDGSPPDSGSTLYDAPISITAPVTIKAVAIKTGIADSAVLTAAYTVKVTTPAVDSPAAGPLHFGDDITFTLSCTTPGASIYYTLDGTSPTSESPVYADAAKPVIQKITAPVTFKAIAVKGDMAGSDVLTAAYTVDYTPPTWNFVKGGGNPTVFGTSIISGVTYGDGKYVAVAESGTIGYSPDGGSSWTGVTSSPFNTTLIKTIVYANSTFVAAGAAGAIAYASSSNLQGWTKVTATNFPSTVMIWAIAHGGNKYVAAGGGGNIVYADDSDLETWTLVPPGTGAGTSTFDTSIIRGIAYGGNKFVAVSQGGKMAWSADGTSWTAISNHTFGATNILGITYGDNKFVAVGANGKIAWSEDGVTSWTAITPGSSAADRDTTFGTNAINGITYGNGHFIAVGAYTAGPPRIGMAASPDGKVWVSIDSKIIVPNTWSVAYGGGRFVAVGGNGNIARSDSLE